MNPVHMKPIVDKKMGYRDIIITPHHLAAITYAIEENFLSHKNNNL